MSTKNWIIGGILMGMTGSVVAAEKKLTRAELPASVLEAVNRESKGATIKGFSTEREHGVKVYEAETVFNGHTRDLQFGTDGTLNEVEEEVAMNALPKPVRDAIVVKAKGASVVKVESLTKKGKLVAYEASTVQGGHKGEVQVGPEGGSLTHEE